MLSFDGLADLPNVLGKDRAFLDALEDLFGFLPVQRCGIELPGDRHSVSANASQTQPAKLLAVFVVDTNETELTFPLGN